MIIARWKLAPSEMFQAPLLMSIVISCAALMNIQAQEHTPSIWLPDLESAYREALVQQRPILVRVGDEGNAWCKRLSDVVARATVCEELEHWTLVYLDAGRQGSEARQLAIGPVPALRALTAQGRLVASQDGFLEEDKLVKWLEAARADATAVPDVNLLGADQPSLIEVMRLVRQFESRDAVIREAAIQRLAPYPASASKAVMKAFRNGSLASKLAAHELLGQWQAPIAAIDPWSKDSMTDERGEQLDRWLEELNPDDITLKELTDEDLDMAGRDIQRLLEAEGAEVAAVRERIARYGDGVLPLVLKQLRDATADRDRERLLALRYRLAANSSLVLTWPGGLERLADRDPEQRHKAAEELADFATADLQPLLLELFSDPDPLVRELSLQGLRHVGGKRATTALVQLLTDPEPNVRAAVLKQLSEDAPKEMIDEIADYVGKESDPDLVVHAVRFFRAVEDTKTLPFLMTLLHHDSWQVRAESAEAITATMNEMAYSMADENVDLPDVHGALLDLLGDPDAFVVSRALEGLQEVDADRAVEPLVGVAQQHPTLARPAVEILANGQRMRDKAIPHLRSFFSGDDPDLRSAAITGLCKLDSDQLQQELPAALTDRHSTVRTAAARSLLAKLTQEVPSSRNGVMAQSSRYGGSVFIEQRPLGIVSNVLQSLFGGPTRPKTIEADEVNQEDQDRTPLQPDPEPGTPNRDPFGDDAPTRPSPTPKTSPADAVTEDRPTQVSAADAAGQSEGDKTETQEPEAANESEGQEDDEPDASSAHDQWLAESYAGKHRPEWMGSLESPLAEMLKAELPAERQAAALALLPFGKLDEALPMIVATVREDRDLYEEVVLAFQWVPQEERQKLFWQLADRAPDDSTRALLVQGLHEFDDASTVAIYWKLLQDDDVSSELISTVEYGLREAIVGEYWYDSSRIGPVRRRRAIKEIEPHATVGTDVERLTAMCLLQSLKAENVFELAKTLADDASASEPTRLDAFQLMLAAQTPITRVETAIDALDDPSVGRRKISLSYLALEDAGFSFLENSHLEIDAMERETSGRSGESKVIIPEPPPGLKPEQLQPLLASSDAQTAAYAGYLLSLFGDPEGIGPLIQYWQSQKNDQVTTLVYRAIASLDDPQYLPHLREIYSQVESTYEIRDFYWTIRIMSGPEILQFRKQIRDEVGMTNLD